MNKILTLNNISVAGLEKLPRDNYEIASEIQHPDAILLRSFKMHDMEIPESLKAVGRAGAGVNNIPVDKMSEKGVVVFNFICIVFPFITLLLGYGQKLWRRHSA